MEVYEHNPYSETNIFEKKLLFYNKIEIKIKCYKFEINYTYVTSQVRKYLLWSKIPRFKLGSNDPRLGMRISQWKKHND